jgi:hypothetical protein
MAFIFQLVVNLAHQRLQTKNRCQSIFKPLMLGSFLLKILEWV